MGDFADPFGKDPDMSDSRWDIFVGETYGDVLNDGCWLTADQPDEQDQSGD